VQFWLFTKALTYTDPGPDKPGSPDGVSNEARGKTVNLINMLGPENDQQHSESSVPPTRLIRSRMRRSSGTKVNQADYGGKEKR
jgi:hypothetical protein